MRRVLLNHLPYKQDVNFEIKGHEEHIFHTIFKLDHTDHKYESFSYLHKATVKSSYQLFALGHKNSTPIIYYYECY